MSNNELHTANPFEAPTGPGQALAGGDMMNTEAQQAIAESQASMVIAKKFPRDRHLAFSRITEDCRRKALAEVGLYSFPRGGEVIKRPSIRLLEVIAQNWGNIHCGVKELSRSKSESVAKSYAWDLETNFKDERIFTVPHVRDTRRGQVKLTDARDIYEAVANMGARRKRAALETVIPKHVIDSARDECLKTLQKDVSDNFEDRVTGMLAAFKDHQQVSKEMIEKRIGHKVEDLSVDEFVDLRTIFNALKEGHGKREDFFEVKAPNLKETVARQQAADKKPTGKNEAKK